MRWPSGENETLPSRYVGSFSKSLLVTTGRRHCPSPLPTQISGEPERLVTYAYASPVGDQTGSFSDRDVDRNGVVEPSIAIRTRSKSSSSVLKMIRFPSGETLG